MGSDKTPKPIEKIQFITEYGLPISVPNANTIDDLRKYLSENPHPEYHLVNCQFLSNSMFLLVWELR